MKKRILGLLLVVAMLVCTLASCGYSYIDDDMNNYASFDFEAFKTALLALEIKDGAFSADETKRDKLVNDEILIALSGAGTKKTDGKLKAGDVIAYSYYCTYGTPTGSSAEDLAAYTVYASNMKGTAPIKLQLGLSDATHDADSFAYKLYQAVKDYEFKASTETEAGNNYGVTVSSSDKVAWNDVVYVTYTKTWSTTTGDVTTEHSFTYTNLRLVNKVTVEGANPQADPFFEKFLDKSVGSVANFTLEDGGITYSYSDVKINWIVENDIEPIVITHTPYKATTSVETVEKNNKTTEGTPGKVDLKDKELTYYIYPVHFEETPELDYKSIIEELLGKNITTDVFSDDTLALKNGDITFETLINGDSSSTEAAMKDSLYTIFYYIEDPDSHTDYDKDAKVGEKNSEKEITERYEGYLKTRLEKIGAIAGIADKIVEDYVKYTYDGLNDKYISEIKVNVVDKLFHLIDEKVVIKDDGKSLPKKAVEEIYDILVENHEAAFYTGTTTVDGATVSNYSKYGTFKNYLCETKREDGEETAPTDDEALARVKADAEAFVTFAVKLYTVSKAYDVVLSEDELEQMKYDDPYYSYYYGSYGDASFELAYQFEELYNELLIIEGEQDYNDDYNAKVEAGEEVDYDFDFDYVDGKIPFVHVKYTITAGN